MNYEKEKGYFYFDNPAATGGVKMASLSPHIKKANYS